MECPTRLVIGLSVLLLAACADPAVQTAAKDHDDGQCVAYHLPPPFVAARGVTAPPHTDVLIRC